jgi:hypothetical protein
VEVDAKIALIQKIKKMENKNPLYNPFDEMDFHFGKCFLTGEPIEKDQITDVFFPWMTQKFGINAKRLSFLSGDQMEYQHFKLPISNQALQLGWSEVQKHAEDLLQAGTAAIPFIQEDKLHAYLSQLWYGVLYHEYFLAKSKLNDRNQQLFDDRVINRVQMLHFVLQSHLGKIKIEGFRPFSIFLFKVHEVKGSNGFDFRTGLNAFTLSLRVGDLGIIVALLDNSVQKKFYSDYFKMFQDVTLHPIQFDELYSMVTYKSFLMNNLYEYGISLPSPESSETILGMRIPENLAETPVFQDWDESVYAQVLLSNMKPYGMEMNDIYHPDHGTATFLEDGKGNVLMMDEVGNPLN